VPQRPQRCADYRHSRSGTIDRVLNQKKYVPEAPQFLRHFYFLGVTMKADKEGGADDRHYLGCGRTTFMRFVVRGRSMHVDFIYLASAAVFFLLSRWLISALDRL
jgi:hypothetical protein